MRDRNSASPTKPPASLAKRAAGAIAATPGALLAALLFVSPLLATGLAAQPAVTVHQAGAADSLVSFVAERASRLLALYDGMFRDGREVESLQVVIPPEPRRRSTAYARPGLISLDHDRAANRGTFMLLAHEAAHLWWLDAEDTQSRHNFLNESFAEYASFLAAREMYGEEAFLRFARSLQREGTGTLEGMIEVLEATTDAEAAAWFDERLST